MADKTKTPKPDTAGQADETTAPTAPKRTASSAVSKRLKTGGMQADTALEVGVSLARICNESEVLRLKTIVFEDSKHMKRTGKIFTECRMNRADLKEKTGAEIYANDNTRAYLADLRADL